MTNRIKQLRKESKMTQAELAKKLGVSPQAVGAYERGSRKVSSKILGKLAEIFNKPAGYIAGEPSEDDVIRFLMDHYNVRGKQSGLGEILSTSWLWSLWERVDNYFIGNGIVSYNVPSEDNLLSEDQAADFEFWKEQFSWLVSDHGEKGRRTVMGNVRYLKESYGKVSESAFATILATTIAANNEVQVYPDVHYKDSSSSEWVVKNSEFMERIIKRQKFLNANLVPNDEPDFIDPYGKPHFDWSFTWELGLPVVDIK
ncbi:helix-turn-helix transcriptional regulator [Lactobacillus delbrueckii subsp. bulgaricus]|nr:hypothetical protein [Lactobacillus delbrueckii subsp. bulgaricus]MBT8809653.1 hypothetical protein [Lactobacillus delbrueckii subsp. bulgaricus]MBT8827062.1 hypothetical protein [Lactobacillus delbrueckii subsp. bulgaricus]MBT8842893.1 hypothetical protein [Lactobacillus delbrueckii subsp. bulgaricus]